MTSHAAKPADVPLGIERVLVANRGEIARRIFRTCREMGVSTVAVYSEADATSLHVREADLSACVGAPPPSESYLNQDRVLEAAQECGADAVHPGYGFLSESPAFARRVVEAGLVWIGPSPEAISSMGDKIEARNLVALHGVPVAPGTPQPVSTLDDAVLAAAELGYPLMVKASGGGGGIGMAIAVDEASLREAFPSTQGRAERFFGSASVLLERYVRNARHIEVQIIGLRSGEVLVLGERDCSVQRRHQKVVEETPAMRLSDSTRERLFAAAAQAAKSVAYLGLGTVEFLLDSDTEEFYFLEMNTRLQVEHPITELVTGLDLVELQLLVAAGHPSVERLSDQLAAPQGHAIEFRIYAEDPVRFLPAPGLITRWVEPTGDGVRVDSAYGEGDRVTPFYDPLLAKVSVWGPDRAAALDRARTAIDGFIVEGLKTNLPFMQRLLQSPEFVSGEYSTSIVGVVLSTG